MSWSSFIPNLQDQRDESDFCRPQPAALLFVLHLTFTFSPPFSFSTTALLTAFSLSHLHQPHDSWPKSSTFYSFICFRLRDPLIFIHPSCTYFNNVTLICMSTFACSSYAHLSCPFTFTAAVTRGLIVSCLMCCLLILNSKFALCRRSLTQMCVTL